MSSSAQNSQQFPSILPVSAAPAPVVLEASSVPMRAVIATAYGSPDVLHLVERQRPSPKPSQVLVQVRASTVTAADGMMRRGDPAYARLFLGLRRPKAAIPGTGLAGIVVAVGSAVTRFAPGDEVFGEAGVRFGAHAEYVAIEHDGVVLRKPPELSFEEAATLCDGPLTSFNFLRRVGQVRHGDRVLVIGASGALGTAGVQIAKSLGAYVVGVCSAKNRDLVLSLGANEAVDYNTDNFLASAERYDVIYDTIGASSYRQCKSILQDGGTYLSPVLSMPLLMQMLWTRTFGRTAAKFDATGLRPADELRAHLVNILSMIRLGRLTTIIERRYRLDAIADAHAHVDSQRKIGSIVISI